MSRILLSPPHLSGRERDFIEDALDSNWIAPLGPHVDAFETELAAHAGVAHAAAVVSGTAALHLALRILGVGAGDTVLCSTFTFIASASPITYVGAAPRFVDADPASWNMDPELLRDDLESAARSGTLPAAVVCVDLYGQTADYTRIEAICAEYGVPLIEDAAEALGADCDGRPAGSFGACSVFSFNGNKVITTSGGGMLGSNDPSITDRARFLATQAREPASHYEHETVGYNYRLSNVLAALGRAQLLTLEDRVAARRNIFERYRTSLGDLPGIEFMPEGSHGSHARWLTVMTIDPAASRVTREELRRTLNEADIEARPAWKPMHLQPVFADAGYVGRGVSDVLFERGLCLPSGSGLSVSDQDRVIEVVREACGD